MALEQVINYDTAGNFTFDSSKIQIVASQAVLKLINNPSQLFSQAFDSATGFTYNASYTEFSGGVVRQKYQLPTNSVLGATYTSTKNLSWATSGSLTATDVGAPTISGGKLVATGGGNVGVYYDNTALAGLADTGTIKFKFTPNYTGAPANNQTIFHIKPSASSENAIILFHGLTSAIRVSAFNSAGGIVHSAYSLPNWSPTSGTEYEFEFVWQASTGVFTLFINGVLFGSTPTTTFTRTNTATRLHLGAGPSYAFSNQSYNDVIAYTNVQHTVGYTPGYSIPEALYLADIVTLPTFTYSGIGSLQAFTAASITEGDSPRYILNGQYWNGSAWAASSNTYATASTKAEIEANIATLAASNTLVVKIVWQDQNVQGSTDLFTATYTGQIYPTDNPTIIPNSGTNVDGLLAFDSILSAAGSDAVKFAIQVGGQDKYWNGTAWANSSSYAQSNTLAEVTANIATLDVAAGYAMKVKAYLHSADGSTSPSLTSVEFSYDFFVSDPTEPVRCVLYGFLKDMAGKVSGEILLTVENSSFEYGNNIVGKYRRVYVFDSDGYVETTPNYLKVADSTAVDGVIETESLALTPYTLTISYKNSNGQPVKIVQENVEIPNSVSENLVNLMVVS